jgi:hypothetical protein
MILDTGEYSIRSNALDDLTLNKLMSFPLGTGS